jgi:hypothetical protein
LVAHGEKARQHDQESAQNGSRRTGSLRKRHSTASPKAANEPTTSGRIKRLQRKIYRDVGAQKEYSFSDVRNYGLYCLTARSHSYTQASTVFNATVQTARRERFRSRRYLTRFPVLDISLNFSGCASEHMNIAPRHVVNLVRLDTHNRKRASFYFATEHSGYFSHRRLRAFALFMQTPQLRAFRGSAPAYCRFVCKCYQSEHCRFLRRGCPDRPQARSAVRIRGPELPRLRPRNLRVCPEFKKQAYSRALKIPSNLRCAPFVMARAYWVIGD